LPGAVAAPSALAALAPAAAPDSTRLAVLAVAALALIGALALACFVKVVGVVFLGNGRDEAAVAAARESPPGLLAPVLVLAAACVLIGLAPALALGPALRVGSLVGGGAAGVTALDLQSVAAAGPLTAFTLALAGGLVLAWLARARLSRRPRGAGSAVRRESAAPTWGCGYPAPTPRMQITASSFAAPLLLEFRALAGVDEQRTAGAFATHAVDPVLAGLALPAWRGVHAAADRLRAIQRRRLALSILYVVAALLALLLYLLTAAGAGAAR
jgi:hydrogenase-4 component B